MSKEAIGRNLFSPSFCIKTKKRVGWGNAPVQKFVKMNVEFVEPTLNGYYPNHLILLILQIKLIVPAPIARWFIHFPVPSECRNDNCPYSTADGLCAYHLTPP